VIPAGLILILAGVIESPATMNGLDMAGWVLLFLGLGRYIWKAATK